jgi:PAT family acetyl-CoA transporter-like MFS transporter 1
MLKQNRGYDPARYFGGDLKYILLFLVLYFYQGLAMGFCFGSFPLLLKRTHSYTEVGIFSLCSWPFSLKFFWSPLVDSHYSVSFGRRKSWIVPLEIMIGTLMIWLSTQVDEMIMSESIYVFTVCVFIWMLLVATHDIAVDGLTIETLLEENKVYASSIQNVGLSLGYYAGFTGLLALYSPSFASMLLGIQTETGLVKISEYVRIWGIVIVISGGLIGLLKNEPEKVYGDHEIGFTVIYKRIYKMLCLSNIKWLVFIFISSSLPSSAHDNGMDLQLTERGFPSETLAFYALTLLPFEIVMCMMVGKLAQHWHELSIYTIGYGIGICVCIFSSINLYYFPFSEMNSIYHIAIIISMMGSILSGCFFTVSMCGFVNRISEASMGGSSITLLMTINNLGLTWPQFIVLSAMDWFQENPNCRQECGSGSECYEKCYKYDYSFYEISSVLMMIGIFYLVFLIIKTEQLKKKPWSSWFVSSEKLLD